MNEFKEKVEAIIKEFEVLTLEKERLLHFEQALALKERELKEFEKQLLEKNKKLLIEKQGISDEKRHLQKAYRDNKLREDASASKEHEVEEATKTLEARLKALGEEEVKVAQKIIVLGDLTMERNQIELDKKHVERERVIDRERKLQLDEQRAHLDKEQERLQAIAIRLKS